MSIWVLMAAFICYSIGDAIIRGAREADAPWLVAWAFGVPFEIGAYVIVASQVGLHT